MKSGHFISPLVVSFVLLSGQSVQAQIGASFGGDARTLGMGGAGVGSGIVSMINPAVLAKNKVVRIQAPGITGRATGAIGSLSDLVDTQNFLKSASSAEDQVSFLAKTYGRSDSSFGASTGVAIQAGPLELGFSGLVSGILQPNAALQQWSTAGGSGLLPSGAAADVSALAMASPSVGFGVNLKPMTVKGVSHTSQVSLMVGARVRMIALGYSRYSATEDDGEFVTQPGSELGGATSVTRTGIGADIGAVGQSRLNGYDIQAGIAIQNFVNPRLSFSGKAGNSFTPTVSTVTVGVSAVKSGLIVAADIADALGSQELRMGVEKQLGPIAIRGGLNSRLGPTVGFGIFGINVAYGKGMPLQAATTVRF